MGLHGAFGENSYYLTENEGKLMISFVELSHMHQTFCYVKR